MRKLHAHKGVALDTVLCRNGAAFVAGIGTREGGSRVTANQNGAAEDKPEQELAVKDGAAVTGLVTGFSPATARFADSLVLALLDDYDHAAATESARKARIDLAAALARTSGCLSESSRGRLASILESWSAGERSKPLRDEIAKAKDAL